MPCTRREWLLAAGAAAAALTTQDGSPRWRFGACDWSIGRGADPGALELAKRLGLDGVQVSCGAGPAGLRISSREVQERYRAAARQHGVALASLALPELNDTPFKSDPRTVDWTAAAIEACRDLGLKVILMAFFHKGDLRDDPAGLAETARRLKALAPAAQKAGVVLGVESWLDAAAHLDLLDQVGSTAVQVYYDVANATAMGHDVPADIRRLGGARICEVHAKENGFLLGEGKVDFRKVREALEEAGFRGWIQIEGALPKGMGVPEAYPRNLNFLRATFGELRR